MTGRSPRHPLRGGGRAPARSAVGGATRYAKLTKDIAASVRLGHPWVFADAIELPRDCLAGEVCDLIGVSGEFVARGVVDPTRHLRFRAWTRDRAQAVDESLLARRLREALALRGELLSPDITAYRLCHGEGDGIPGLHADVYGAVLSLRTDGGVGLAWRERFVRGLDSLRGWDAIVHRHPEVMDGAAEVIAGAVPGTLRVQEGERSYWVDVVHGQKTGFFCDQRDNRDLIQKVAAGRRVLNLFSYTGGFSVAAALGGASRVVSVDIAGPAIALARDNFRLNDIPDQGHGFVVGDAFAYLEAEAASEAFDLVIVDPPSFVSSRQKKAQALRAYTRLNALAMRALPAGAWLASASCSSHIHTPDFLRILADAAVEAERSLRVTHVLGPGADHPTPAAFPEGRYLQFVLAQVTPGR